ncbi:MAG: cupin domain-containing protein [Candidatus Methanofastidiosa archaeon]|nr:cupin domain-containing protein [Candidatus Methanofastidiosa archaeon]
MIYHKNVTEIKERKIEADDAKGVSIAILVGEDQGAKNFFMRIMKIEKEGFSPYHRHEWEHENFILKGEGYLKTEKGKSPVKKGDVIYIPPNELHSYINTGNEELEVMCIIPSML